MSVDKSVLKLVVFDCDGTLVDSQYNIINCMTSAFNACGLKEPKDADVRSIIGLNLDQAIHQLMQDKDDLELLGQLVDGYKNAFRVQRLEPDHQEPLYAGALDALKLLDDAGTLMGVATGKSLRGLRAVIDMHDLNQFFMTLQTPDHNPGKPHPQMLEKAMSDAGTDPANTYMIGDTSYDMMLAKNAGCHAIGVSWGYHDEEMLRESGADHLIHNYSELFGIVHP
ncbi:MAG: HAD-IA family hydrolase [Sneathiella sp.]|nr:HAD-IA family hydrolase [Sneathiella sp.]